MITNTMNIVHQKKEKKLEVRLAENQLEIEQVLSLRFRVFNEEMGEGLPQSRENQKDRDDYDQFCDHLIVIDKNNDNRIVGTYRLLRGEVAKRNIGFYSETEFDLSTICTLDSELAELGRSCVDPDYRDGSVLAMLWGGLAWYIKQFNVRYLVGCGSIHSTDSCVANAVYAYFRNKNALTPPELRVRPLETHRVVGFDPQYVDRESRRSSLQVPPLIKGYLRAGARIAGEPALDALFGVIDFFIFFDAFEIDRKYGRHYLPNKGIAGKH